MHLTEDPEVAARGSTAALLASHRMSGQMLGRCLEGARIALMRAPGTEDEVALGLQTASHRLQFVWTPIVDDVQVAAVVNTVPWGSRINVWKVVAPPINGQSQQPGVSILEEVPLHDEVMIGGVRGKNAALHG